MIKLRSLLRHFRPDARSRGTRPGANSDNLELSIVDVHNQHWKNARRGKRLSFVKDPIIKAGDATFIMGSCFAHEVRGRSKISNLTLFQNIRRYPLTQKTNASPGYPIFII